MKRDAAVCFLEETGAGDDVKHPQLIFGHRVLFSATISALFSHLMTAALSVFISLA